MTVEFRLVAQFFQFDEDLLQCSWKQTLRVPIAFAEHGVGLACACGSIHEDRCTPSLPDGHRNLLSASPFEHLCLSGSWAKDPIEESFLGSPTLRAKKAVAADCALPPDRDGRVGSMQHSSASDKGLTRTATW
eukprot:CAMPEP_0206437506 /NCGR_PEP_ID=MMETSP0324_2-20121206/11081_1 /ASSEMBLY_ACC=CAM_ASM_000836 /TAXON_ID=2866 /ORGANISM="Crypthecodinium cohnii, Strain Seligo" /LENGTH=132 /DNA_ID=CAMNT_0053904799 /DNA_START=483 /DNA_END=878 /DNA_ORIENTATION=-